MRQETWSTYSRGRSFDDDDVELMAAVEHARRRNRRRRGASSWDSDEWHAYGYEPVGGACDWEGNDAD
jgi:hypothetical protein